MSERCKRRKQEQENEKPHRPMNERHNPVGHPFREPQTFLVQARCHTQKAVTKMEKGPERKRPCDVREIFQERCQNPSPRTKTELAHSRVGGLDLTIRLYKGIYQK